MPKRFVDGLSGYGERIKGAVVGWVVEDKVYGFRIRTLQQGGQVQFEADFLESRRGMFEVREFLDIVEKGNGNEVVRLPWHEWR